MLGQRLATALPPEDVCVDIDPERMRQVLLNLLQNAAVHGGGSSRVVLRAVGEPDAWRFEVADEGGGVPAGPRGGDLRAVLPRHAGQLADRASASRWCAPWPAPTAAPPGVVNRPGRGVTFWVRVPA